jgi:hypothetical protein
MRTRLKIMSGDTCWPDVYCYKLIMAEMNTGHQNTCLTFLVFFSYLAAT